jgi:hypothetical protein
MRKIIGVVAAVLLFAGSPAHAAPPTAEVEILWTLLVAKGAAVDVSYGVTCPDGFTGTTKVTITQVRDDGLLATGATTEELACGALGMARVTASVLGAPFERGRARLSMLVTGCNGPACFGVPIDQNIRIEK